MKHVKEIITIILAGIFVLLFLAEIVAAVHSTWFMFTHIHLTRMEAFFDPDNFMGYKIFGLVLLYIDFQLIKAISD